LHAVRIAQRRNEIGAEHLEIHGGAESFKLIAEIAQPPQTIVDVEKSRLAPHRSASRPFTARESQIIANR
jgi:hypothetical protein